MGNLYHWKSFWETVLVESDGVPKPFHVWDP